MGGQKTLFLRLVLFGVFLAWISFFSRPASAQVAHQVVKGTSVGDSQRHLGECEPGFHKPVWSGG